MDEMNAVKKYTTDPRKIRSAKIVQVIRTESVIGTGKENDPVRSVVQFWTPKGVLIATTASNDLYEFHAEQE